MDGLRMHRWGVMRLTASDGREYWVYQFPMSEWKVAIRRIMYDVHRARLPETAAGGLLSIIAEEIANAD